MAVQEFVGSNIVYTLSKTQLLRTNNFGDDNPSWETIATLGGSGLNGTEFRDFEIDPFSPAMLGEGEVIRIYLLTDTKLYFSDQAHTSTSNSQWLDKGDASDFALIRAAHQEEGTIVLYSNTGQAPAEEHEYIINFDNRDDVYEVIKDNLWRDKTGLPDWDEGFGHDYIVEGEIVNGYLQGTYQSGANFHRAGVFIDFGETVQVNEVSGDVRGYVDNTNPLLDVKFDFTVAEYNDANWGESIGFGLDQNGVGSGQWHHASFTYPTGQPNPTNFGRYMHISAVANGGTARTSPFQLDNIIIKYTVAGKASRVKTIKTVHATPNPGNERTFGGGKRESIGIDLTFWPESKMIYAAGQDGLIYKASTFDAEFSPVSGFESVGRGINGVRVWRQKLTGEETPKNNSGGSLHGLVSYKSGKPAVERTEDGFQTLWEFAPGSGSTDYIAAGPNAYTTCDHNAHFSVFTGYDPTTSPPNNRKLSEVEIREGDRPAFYISGNPTPTPFYEMVAFGNYRTEDTYGCGTDKVGFSSDGGQIWVSKKGSGGSALPSGSYLKVLPVLDGTPCGEHEMLECDKGDTGEGCDPTSANPIQLRSGNKVQSETDLSIQTPVGTLNFTRSYIQDKQQNSDFQFMGLGWTHNHLYRLSIAGDVATVRLDNGGLLKLNEVSSGHFKAAIGSSSTLDYNSGPQEYILTAQDKTTYIFDWTSGSPTQGLLKQRKWPNGEAWNYSYTGNNLTQVSDDYNRSLQFAYYVTSDYTNGKLWRVADYTTTNLTTTTPDGRYIEFTYSPANNTAQALLTGVTDVRGPNVQDRYPWGYTYYDSSAGNKADYLHQRLSPPLGGTASELILEELDYIKTGSVIDSIDQARGNGLLKTRFQFNQTLNQKTATYERIMDSTWQQQLAEVIHYFAAGNGGVYLGPAIQNIGRQRKVFNRHHRPVLQVDPNFNETLLEWSGDGKHLQKVTDAMGNTTRFAHNTDDTLNQIVDAEGQRTIYRYAPNALRQPRLILLTDADEVLLNGDMELDPAVSWGAISGANPQVNQRSQTQVDSGSYSRYIETNGLDQGIESSTWTLEANQPYTIFARVYVVAGAVKMQVPSLSDFDKTSMGTGKWETLIASYTPTSQQSNKVLQFVSISNPNSQFYIDSVIVIKGSILRFQESAYDNKGRTLSEKLLSPVDGSLIQETQRSYYVSGNGNGLLQRVIQKDLGNLNDVITTYFYDSLGRVIQTNQSSNLGSCDKTRAIYNMAGQLEASICNFDLDVTGTPNASSNNAQAGHAFDDDEATFWSGITATNEWIQYDFGLNNAKLITSVALTTAKTDLDQAPLDFRVEASHDANNWDVKTTVTDQTAWTPRETRVFTFTNTTAYRYWRIFITAANGGSVVSLAEFEMIASNFPSSATEALALRASTSNPNQNRVTLFEYDRAGRLIRTRLNAGTSDEQINVSVYDALGRVIRSVMNYTDSSDPENWVWDDQNHIWRQSSQGGATAISHGSQQTQNIVTDIRYNARGLVGSQMDVLGNVALLGYDAAGRQVKIIQNASNPNYNVTNDPTLTSYTPVIDADLDLITSYQYDANGNPVKVVNALGQVTFTVFDALNRVTKVLRNASQPNYDLTQDPYLNSYPISNLPDRDVLTRQSYDGLGRIVQSWDELGNCTLLGYDNLGRQVKAIRSASQPDYDLTQDPDLSNYPLSSATDRDLVSKTNYDAQNGRVLHTEDPFGSKTWLAYDGLGRPTRVVVNAVGTATDGGVNDPRSSSYNASSDADKDIISLTNYDADGRVRWTQDMLGRKTWHVYDEFGRQIKTIVNCTYTGTGTAPEDSNYTGSPDSDKDVITRTMYDVLGRVTSSFDERGNETRYEYDSLGRQILVITNYVDGIYSSTTPDEDLIQAMTYNLRGRVVQTLNSGGNVTRYIYDKLGRRTRTITNYLAQSTSDPADWAWDEQGGVWRQNNQGGATAINHGTAFDQNLISDVVYNKGGQVVFTRDTRGTKTSFIYDGVGRRREVEEASSTPLAASTYTCYDKSGRVLRTIRNWTKVVSPTPDERDTSGNWLFAPSSHGAQIDRDLITTYQRDRLGRVIEMVDSMGNKTRTVYEKDGRVQSVTDPMGTVTRNVYDNMRRLKRVIQNYVDDYIVLPRICFAVGNGVNNINLYTVRSDGTSLTQLTTQTGEAHQGQTWSPDGTKILYVAFINNDYEIYVMNADGTGQTRLTTQLGFDFLPAWSPNGTKIAFSSTRNALGAELYVMDSDGTDVVRLTTNWDAEGLPVWSPDGTKILFSLNTGTTVTKPIPDSDIFVVNANGTNFTRLTTSLTPKGSPVWSPDGKRIAYAAVVGKQGQIYQSDAYLMNADGSNKKRLTFLTNQSLGGLMWSPDGTQLVFHALADNRLETYVVNADGTGLRRLTWYGGSVPAWSPDGKQIAYISTINGNNQIFIMDADGSNAHQITYLTSGSIGGPLAWSPQGAVTDPATWLWDGTTDNRWENANNLAIQHGSKHDRNIIVDLTLDKAGRRVAMRNPLGRETTYAYDLLDRRTTLTNPSPFQNQAWATAYTDLSGGRSQITSTDPMSQQIEQEFDRLGRLVQLRYPGETTPKATPDVTFSYDAFGNRIGMSEYNGISTIRQTHYDYDDARRLTQVRFDEDGDGDDDQVVSYVHDVGGLRTSLTLPGNLTITYAYNVRGELVSLTDWDSQQTHYTYDLDGRLMLKEEANGLRSQYRYDAGGRLKQLRHSQGSLVITDFDYEVDARGNRIKAVERFADSYPTANDTTITSNDPAVEYYQGTWTADSGFMRSDNYGASFRIMFFGKQIQLTLGRGTDHGICDVYLDNVFWGSINSYHTASGQHTKSITLDSEGVHVLDVRNRDERVTNRRLRFYSLVVEDSEYTLQTIQYAYDGLTRLTDADYFAGDNTLGTPFRAYDFAYDRAGNRTQQVLNDGTVKTFNYTYNELNRLTQYQQVGQSAVNLTYNNAGQMTSDATNTYTWDRAGRLLSMGGSSHLYNGKGQRIQQTVGGNATHYLLDVQLGLYEVLAATTGANTTRYVHEPFGLSRQQQPGSDWVYPLHDGLGSVRRVLNEALSPLYTTHYGPYGDVWGQQGTNPTMYGFTDEPTDQNGLVHLRARHYNPGLGVFPTLDGVEYANRYAYVHGNPVNYKDPSGYCVFGLPCPSEDDVANVGIAIAHSPGKVASIFGLEEEVNQAIGGYLSIEAAILDSAYQAIPGPVTQAIQENPEISVLIAAGALVLAGGVLAGGAAAALLAIGAISGGINGGISGGVVGYAFGNAMYDIAASGQCGPCTRQQVLQMGKSEFVQKATAQGALYGTFFGGAIATGPFGEMVAGVASIGFGLQGGYAVAPKLWSDIKAGDFNVCHVIDGLLSTAAILGGIGLIKSGYKNWQKSPQEGSLQGERIGLLNLLKLRIMKEAGFDPYGGTPLILDSSLGANIADGLRGRGYNARTVWEIFRRDQIYDPEIRALGNSIDAWVIHSDISRDVNRGGGFIGLYERQLYFPQRLKTTLLDEVIKVLEERGIK